MVVDDSPSGDSQAHCRIAARAGGANHQEKACFLKSSTPRRGRPRIDLTRTPRLSLSMSADVEIVCGYLNVPPKVNLLARTLDNQ